MEVVFNPKRPLTEIYELAARDLEAYRQVSDKGLQTRWEAWAGDRLSSMRNDPDVTIKYLANADTTLRLAAASLVADYWPSDPSFAGPCLRLAFDDPDTLVRGAALDSLIYKLYPYVDDALGLFRQLLTRLRAIEIEPFPVELFNDVRQHGIEISKWADERAASQYRELAGEHAGSMLESAAIALEFVRHPLARLRRAALLALHKHWAGAVDLRPICLSLISEDSCVEVRIEAQSILSAAYYRTNDVEIGRFLAEIVENCREPMELRRDAYTSLFMVRSMPVERILRASAIRFPDDVEWEFVRTFQRTERE